MGCKHANSAEQVVELSKTDKWCLNCYLQRYLQGQAPSREFKSIPKEYQTHLGRLILKKELLHNPVQGKGDDDTIHQYGSYYWKELDRVCESLKDEQGGTCFAMARGSSTLIVAENNNLPNNVSFLSKHLGLGDMTKGVTAVICLDWRGGARFTLDESQVTWSQDTAFNCGISPRRNVHAELRVLEYLHSVVPLPQNQDYRPVYIGIDKGSCGKCETVISEYNRWSQKRFVAVHRGFHDMYSAEWKLPKGLMALMPKSEYRLLKRALGNGGNPG
ncbi:hypothetical protein [Archangium sp.]|jgi:hypothetical protein|uniref:hypothetical protein n=1 Tax=Archangium sp. TaxID=1872627 RepID=UPI002EDB7258